MDKLGMSLDDIIKSQGKAKEPRKAKEGAATLAGPKAKKTAAGPKDKIAVAAASASKKRTEKAAAKRQSIASGGAPRGGAKSSPAPPKAPKAKPSPAPKPRAIAQQKKRGAVAAAGKASPGPKRPGSGAGDRRPPGPARPLAAPVLPTGLKITIKNDLFQARPQSGKKKPSKFGQRR